MHHTNKVFIKAEMKVLNTCSPQKLGGYFRILVFTIIATIIILNP